MLLNSKHKHLQLASKYCKCYWIIVKLQSENVKSVKMSFTNCSCYTSQVDYILYMTLFSLYGQCQRQRRWLLLCSIFLSLQITFVVGCCLEIAAPLWFYLLKTPPLEIFGPAILQGAGSATLLVTSLSMTADLIGEHTVSNNNILSFKRLLLRIISRLNIHSLFGLHWTACFPLFVFIWSI